MNRVLVLLAKRTEPGTRGGFRKKIFLMYILSLSRPRVGTPAGVHTIHRTVGVKGGDTFVLLVLVASLHSTPHCTVLWPHTSKSLFGSELAPVLSNEAPLVIIITPCHHNHTKEVLCFDGAFRVSQDRL